MPFEHVDGPSLTRRLLVKFLHLFQHPFREPIIKTYPHSNAASSSSLFPVNLLEKHTALPLLKTPLLLRRYSHVGRLFCSIPTVFRNVLL